MNSLPDDLLLKTLKYVKGQSMLVVVPHVCKRWRAACQSLRCVHLDLTWCKFPIPAQTLFWYRQLLPNIDAVTFNTNNGVTDAMVSAVGGVKRAILYDCFNLTKVCGTSASVCFPRNCTPHSPLLLFVFRWGFARW